MVLLYNDSTVPFQVNQGDRIAQLVIYNIEQPKIQETQQLDDTARGTKGCGHTGINKHPTVRTLHPNVTDDGNCHMLDKTLKQIEAIEGIKPYNIWLRPDPFHKHLTIYIPAKGSHPTLGMILKHTTTHQLDETSVASNEDVLQAIIKACNKGQDIVKCEFAIMEYQPLHPVEGSSMLHYDQLNAVSKHMQGEPNTETTAMVNSITDTNIKPDELGQSFKLNQLKKRPDWPEWQKARYKMLDSYLDQEMFSDSMENPKKCQCTPHAMAVHS
jgi:hypothetical protein